MNKTDIKKLNQIIEKTISLLNNEDIDPDYELTYSLYDLQELLNNLDEFLSHKDIVKLNLINTIKEMELEHTVDKSKYYIDQEEKWTEITLSQQNEIARLQSLLKEKNKGEQYENNSSITS